MVNDTVYLPGATIPITDVGDSYPPGSIASSASLRLISGEWDLYQRIKYIIPSRKPHFE